MESARSMVLQDGTKVPLVWDGTRWDVVDYRKYRSVGEYKEAVDATGLRFAICCAWPMSRFMKENGLAFPGTFELMTQGYEKAAAKHGLRRRKDNYGSLILVDHGKPKKRRKP
jgi:hypothetical protein